MAIEAGSKLEGKVTGIAKFGAFVELEGGKTGLVHISEVADQYVNDVNDYLSVGDTVTVKVMKVEDDGKIALSIRKAEAPKQEQQKSDHRKKGKPSGGEKQRGQSFEEKMNQFLKDSDERLSTLRKQSEGKRGSKR
ncbi:S1 RNA binding domain protein [Salsuginibacillus halophilus]|uniref:S1 RNA binding domain protein n=1 Tax=Salsuginibacillus halophilus TaxID=517424 RepID=A0A2P8H7Q6_9BACI|nr:S1 domain-containing RNA-binding protein [Salsuginibacillus halophilus]PSL42265.1 S1 RNA binding domain protein [Salsuginibacillus halophilus]